MKIENQCKNCIGCNKLEDENFEGYQRCPLYIKANERLDVGLLLTLIFEMLAMFIVIGLIYFKLMLKVGG